jgi:hypothetical protein
VVDLVRAWRGGFVSQRADGASWSLALVGAQSVGPLLVVVLAVRYGEGGRNRAQWLLLALAALGISGWAIAGDAWIATMCVVTAYSMAVLLMLPKIYRDPRSETLATYALGALSGLLAAAAVGHWRPSLLVYPGYVAIANGLTAIAIVLRRRGAPAISPLG